MLKIVVNNYSVVRYEVAITFELCLISALIKSYTSSQFKINQINKINSIMLAALFSCRLLALMALNIKQNASIDSTRSRIA